MKKFAILFLLAISLITISSCGQNNIGGTSATNTEIPYTGAPKIEIDGISYYAENLEILNELPYGYIEAGELTQEQMKCAYILGSKYYINPDNEPLKDFYVYQECGTRMEDGSLDNTQRQWAYVHWTAHE